MVCYYSHQFYLTYLLPYEHCGYRFIGGFVNGIAVGRRTEHFRRPRAAGTWRGQHLSAGVTTASSVANSYLCAPRWHTLIEDAEAEDGGGDVA